MSTPAPTLNDPAERKNRQLAYAQRVQELTMRLVVATAERAEHALKQPEPDPETAPRTRAPNHISEFVQLTRALNQTMIIENRVANDDFAGIKRHFRSAGAATSATARPAANPQDPRRPLVRHALYDATRAVPDRARRRREIDDSIEQHLAADPAQTAQAINILQAVSEALDIHIDPARLTDEILGMEPRRPPRPLNL